MTKPDAVREALLLAHETFLRYAKLHRDKGTPDGDEKAAANQALGERMYAAVLSEQPAPTTPARVALSDQRVRDIWADECKPVRYTGELVLAFARVVIAEYERLSGITPAQGKVEQG